MRIRSWDWEDIPHVIDLTIVRALFQTVVAVGRTMPGESFSVEIGLKLSND